MPAPEFEWKTYQVQARDATLDYDAPAPRTAATVEIPDLTNWPQPHDKAKILLETAAEVEHALLVQYLYAAFSLKSGDEVADPGQQSALFDWSSQVVRTARDEMGHLMTVQNLLLGLGQPPNLEREDFPPRKDLYPFKLHLEALSQRSLAKYVTAESPADAAGIDDIVTLATDSAGTLINHVGVIYALLGVIFSTEQEVVSGGSSSPSWDEQLRRYADAAHQQTPAATWHLGDSAIDPQTLDRQADPNDWQGGGVRIHPIADRSAAREAIRDIAEQGEGPTDSGEDSHFDRFRKIYRGGDGLPPFPPAGGWIPTHAVPTDPVAAAIAEPRTQRWAQLADLRYGLLLGFIEHYLRTSDTDVRANLRRWSVDEMFALEGLAGRLGALPQGSGVAALPFKLPDPLHLPDTDAQRWELQRTRTEASIALVTQMQSDPLDAGDSTLSSLRDTDTDRLTEMAGGGPAQPTTSFARDVLPLFRPIDIEHMTDFGLDLSDLESVRAAAPTISARMKRTGAGRMPPPPDAPLTPAQIAVFDTWVAEGAQP